MTGHGSARVTFLGHSTSVIEMDGARILTDPILRPRVGPLLREGSAVRRELWSDIDIVVISHSHWDHLDVGSLRMLGTSMPIVVPLGLGSGLRRRGFREIIEVRVGDEVDAGALRLEAVHAEHKGFAPPVSGTDTALGFLVHGSQRHYFAGDTAWFEGMAELAQGLDLALIPVWGWGPSVRASEHLDPFGAAKAISVLEPRYAVPIHWGTLYPVGLRWMRPATRIDPPHQFAQLARRVAPRTMVHVLPVGSTLEVPAAR